MPKQPVWEDISDILSPEGLSKVKVGNVLMFDFEGSRNELKIMRITKTSPPKVFAKSVTTYDPLQVETMVANAENAAHRQRKLERKKHRHAS